MPGRQYSRGRQRASVEEIQCHEPACCGWEVTAHVALEALRGPAPGTSKVTTTGIPTPTVSPFSGATEAKVCSARLSARVRNDRFSTTRSPASSVATDPQGVGRTRLEALGGAPGRAVRGQLALDATRAGAQSHGAQTPVLGS